MWVRPSGFKLAIDFKVRKITLIDWFGLITQTPEQMLELEERLPVRDAGGWYYSSSKSSTFLILAIFEEWITPSVSASIAAIC